MSFLAKLQLGSTEFNVLKLEYKIAQNVDQQGKPDGKPKGGFIHLTVESSNKNDLAEWAISPTMTKTGTLTFVRRDTNSAMKTLSFQDAFCTGYKELFDARDENPMRIDLVISAGEIKVNSTSVTRPWSSEMAVVAAAVVVAEVLSGREEEVVEKKVVVEEKAVIKRIALVKADPPFKPGKGLDKTEFERQIAGQQAGMNKLTIAEFLKNRDDFENRKKLKKQGRSSEGSRAQKDFREKEKKRLIKEYRKSKLPIRIPYNEAKTLVEKDMKGKAALHDPDQIAGGKANNITGLGDSKTNSSIGSQWKTRIKKIEERVRALSEKMTVEEMEKTQLDIHLYP